MTYLLPTALVFGQTERKSSLDRSNSVLRLSPRNKDAGVRNWIVNEKTPDRHRPLGGVVRVQPPRQHRVVAAWGGSGRPTAAVQGNRTEIDAESNRKSHRQWTHLQLLGRTDLRQTHDGRRQFGPNVKLVFLKDTPDLESQSSRLDDLFFSLGSGNKTRANIITTGISFPLPLRHLVLLIRKADIAISDSRLSQLTTLADDSGASSGDETRVGSSSSTPGTLSPAEALTVSRYSSRAMSSSYMGSSAVSSSRDTGRETSDGNERSDVDTTDDEGDEDDDSTTFRPNSEDMRSAGSRYFTPESGTNSSTGDELTTKSGRSSSTNYRRYRDAADRCSSTDWHRGDQRVTAAGSTRRNLRVTLDDDGAMTGTKRQGDDASAAVHAVNTSRTCSNELLNVISIDDDKLRYRHYNNSNNSRSINNRNDNTTMKRINGKTAGDQITNTNSRRQAASVGRAKTELTTTVAAAGDGRRGQMHQGSSDGGRQRLLDAIEKASNQVRHQQQQQQQQQNRSQNVTKSNNCPPERNGAKRALANQPSPTSSENRTPSYSSGGTMFAEMNRTLRQTVENVWEEERRRSIAIFLGSRGDAMSGVGPRRRERTNPVARHGGHDNVATVIGESTKRRQQADRKDFGVETFSIASGCSLY